MKAYKCDRCGKLFEKYKNQGTSEFFNITHNPCISGYCLDLCPNCNAELQEWVANDKEQVACDCTDEEIAKSFIEDVEAVKDLLPKTGRWIEHFDDSGKWYECDQCHTDWGGPVNYCPNCGAKMKVGE